MTQPPLSQAIQALEENLGTTLFIRSTRKITLSAAGVALLPEARRLLQQAAALPALARRAGFAVEPGGSTDVLSLRLQLNPSTREKT